MTVSRRAFLDLGLVAAATAALPDAAQAQAAAMGPQPGDVFVAVDDPAHTIIRADALIPGHAPIVAWPMDATTSQVRDAARFNQILLLRLPSPDAPKLLAFSAICTHAGCLVSGWLPETERLLCPCHRSTYDPANDGAVLIGPAPVPLPSLPVGTRDGQVVVAGAFSARPGARVSRTM
jgi:rieske iron-sulfur protein